ncbi:MAG: hypothetical protein ABIE07_01425 [Candidatus Zixiibacteriota bacterium]
MSVKKKYPLAIFSEIPKKNMLELIDEKRDFVNWLKDNVESESMKKMALEHAAFYFLNVRYDLAIQMLRKRIEDILSFKLNLADKCHQHRMNILSDYQKLKMAVLEANKEKTKLLNVPEGTLLPAELQQERLRAINEREKGELRKLQMEQKKRRFYHKALALDAAERAKLRSEFVAQMKQEIDDPEILEDTIDEYDKIISQSQVHLDE